MFPDLIDSTVRLARSFSNLRFLCLSRLNGETIMSCLERGVGKNLQALSITLPEVDDSDASLTSLAHRIANLTTLFRLQAIQINDIEPTSAELINRANNLKEISLNITNSTSKMFQLLNHQETVKKLEIFGGFREARNIGPTFFQLIHSKFPAVEVFKCALHVAGNENLRLGEISQYATALARFVYLRQFVFNHYNLPHFLVYSGEPVSHESVLERFLTYSEPYFRKSSSLRELIYIDFSDRQSVSGIIAQRINSDQDARVIPNIYTCDDQVGKQDGFKGIPAESIHSENFEGDPTKGLIKMSKISDVREKNMVSFEHRWTKID